MRFPIRHRSFPTILIERFTGETQHVTGAGADATAILAGPQPSTFNEQELATRNTIAEMTLAIEIPTGGKIYVQS